MQTTAEPVEYRVGPAAELPEADQFMITVRQLPNGKWCASYRERYLDSNGEWIRASLWSREPETAAERAQFAAEVDAWKERVQHNRDTALALARIAAPAVMAMGMTASEYVTRESDRAA